MFSTFFWKILTSFFNFFLAGAAWQPGLLLFPWILLLSKVGFRFLGGQKCQDTSQLNWYSIHLSEQKMRDSDALENRLSLIHLRLATTAHFVHFQKTKFLSAVVSFLAGNNCHCLWWNNVNASGLRIDICARNFLQLTAWTFRMPEGCGWAFWTFFLSVLMNTRKGFRLVLFICVFGCAVERNVWSDTRARTSFLAHNSVLLWKRCSECRCTLKPTSTWLPI